MDPISALILAALVFTGGVTGWFSDQKQRIFGDGSRPIHERKMQEAKQRHERRMQADQHRHAEHMAGWGRPTLQDAVADRIKRGRTPYTEMGPIRRWLYDLYADRLQELTRERRERERRRAAGEQEWQKWAAWFRARWEQAKDDATRSWQERHAEQDPHGRIWVDSEQDWPDPNTPDPGVADAEVVDDQSATPEPRQIEPGWPGDNPAPEPQPASTEPIQGTTERIYPQGSDNNGGTGMTKRADGLEARVGLTGDPVVAERERDDGATVRTILPGSGGWTAAGEHAADTKRVNGAIDNMRRDNRGSSSGGGVPAIAGGPSGAIASLNGETVDPESLAAFANGIDQVAAACRVSIESSRANLDAVGVSGGPIDHLMEMSDAAEKLAASARSTAQYAASHSDIQSVAQSDPTVGGEQYLGIGHARR